MPRIMNNAPKIFVYLSRAPSIELPLFLLQYESAFEAEPLIAPRPAERPLWRRTIIQRRIPITVITTDKINGKCDILIPPYHFAILKNI